jgi:hypothetical protein
LRCNLISAFGARAEVAGAFHDCRTTRAEQASQIFTFLLLVASAIDVRLEGLLNSMAAVI